MIRPIKSLHLDCAAPGHPTPVTASVLARTAPWSTVIDEEWDGLQEKRVGAARFRAGCADEAPALSLDPRFAAIDTELLARLAPRLLLGALAEVGGLTLVVGPLALASPPKGSTGDAHRWCTPLGDGH